MRSRRRLLAFAFFPFIFNLQLFSFFFGLFYYYLLQRFVLRLQRSRIVERSPKIATLNKRDIFLEPTRGHAP